MQLLHPDTSLRVHLANSFDCLSKAQQKVVAWLLSEGRKYPEASLAEVAEHAQVCQSVVVRTCQALGMAGFREFRIRWLKEETSNNNKPTDSVKEQMFHSVNMAVRDTMELLDSQAVRAAAEDISRTRNVIIYGHGRSGMVGDIAHAQLWHLGCRVLVLMENNMKSASLELADKDTTVLIVSHRGERRGMIARLENDRQRGATVILLTSGAQSSLAKHADIVLLTGCPVGASNKLLNYSAARVAQVAAIQVLVETVRLHMEQRSQETAS